MSLAIFRKPHLALVVSEPDLDTALAHLRSLPYQNASPVAWERQRLIQQIREAIGADRHVNGLYGIAPGVFAIVKPFGIDLARGAGEPDGRLQAAGHPLCGNRPIAGH
ncbi:hypothetical protein [Cupriavidus sp. D39]|uniref:hypothetical protein n=1 Tax=Cupriavidus sp. D39 TaxID=2997877 RepID=UPI00226E3558|nr:hypothetical protein [Cupriavidus sp. D39]MCY0852530.1 hypothetical protein [Cupriavidus sp. D39]